MKITTTTTKMMETTATMTRSKYHTYYICYHFEYEKIDRNFITNVEKQYLIFIYLCIITSSFIEKVGVEIV